MNKYLPLLVVWLVLRTTWAADHGIMTVEVVLPHKKEEYEYGDFSSASGLERVTLSQPFWREGPP